MNANPTLPRRHIATTVGAGFLSAFIAIGLLSAVSGLFQRGGAPFEQVVIAERACADRTFVSERDTCVRLYLAAARVKNVASR